MLLIKPLKIISNDKEEILGSKLLKFNMREEFLYLKKSPIKKIKSEIIGAINRRDVPIMKNLFSISKFLKSLISIKFKKLENYSIHRDFLRFLMDSNH